MNPDDDFRGRGNYFDRTKGVPKGMPSDRQKAKKPQPARPGKAVGGTFPGTSYDQLMQQINKSFIASFTMGGSTQETTFSGKDFAAGTAKGARSFKVDALGRLTGIHYSQVWLPGENVAECRADQPHKDGEYPNCKCGFYGYYDGSNDYYSPGYVSAVVEGYGEAVMGSQGFRVTKARILALSIDDDVRAKNAHLVRRNYTAIPMFDSFSRMVAEYPTDFELDSKIPSPDEDDFWTRNA